MPVSRTSIAASHRPSGSGAPDTARTTSPDSVNFTAFDSRLSRICRKRPASPTSGGGASSGAE